MFCFGLYVVLHHVVTPYYSGFMEANGTLIIIIIIMVIFKYYFSGEQIALSINKNNNGVNIALGKTNRLKALCMMQINT